MLCTHKYTLNVNVLRKSLNTWMEAGSKDTFVVRRYVKVFDVTLVVESVVEVDMTVRPAAVASQHPTLTHGVQDTTVC